MSTEDAITFSPILLPLFDAATGATEDTIMRATAACSATEAWNVASWSDRTAMAEWGCWPMPGDLDAARERLGRELEPDEVEHLGDMIAEGLALLADEMLEPER